MFKMPIMAQEPESISSILSNLYVSRIVIGFAVLLIGGCFWRWWDNKRSKNIETDSDPNNIKATPIAGKWITSYKEDEQDFQEKAEIRGHGNNVWGTIDLIDLDDPNRITDSYEFKGNYKDRILAGTYESKDQNVYEQGAFLLELQGKILTGEYLFFNGIS